MKCNHLRIIIQKESTASTIHIRNKQGVWISDSDFGDYTGRMNVKCIDCGLHRTYYKHKKMPKWLQKCFKELNL